MKTTLSQHNARDRAVLMVSGHASARPVRRVVALAYVNGTDGPVAGAESKKHRPYLVGRAQTDCVRCAQHSIA